MAMEEPNISITTVKMWKGKKNVMEEDKQLCKFTCCSYHKEWVEESSILGMN